MPRLDFAMMPPYSRWKPIESTSAADHCERSPGRRIAPPDKRYGDKTMNIDVELATARRINASAAQVLQIADGAGFHRR